MEAKSDNDIDKAVRRFQKKRQEEQAKELQKELEQLFCHTKGGVK